MHKDSSLIIYVGFLAAIATILTFVKDNIFKQSNSNVSVAPSYTSAEQPNKLPSASTNAETSRLPLPNTAPNFTKSQSNLSVLPQPENLPRIPSSTDLPSPQPSTTPKIVPIPSTSPSSATPFKRTVKVSADSDCTDTGILLRGESVGIEAKGRATYGAEGESVNGKPLNDYPETDPDGNRFIDGRNIGKKKGGETKILMRSKPIGSLIARVGEGNLFFVGSRNTFRKEEGGNLFLCYNDASDTLEDNGGFYTVNIWFN